MYIYTCNIILNLQTNLQCFFKVFISIFTLTYVIILYLQKILQYSFEGSSDLCILSRMLAHRRPLDFGFLADSAPDISDQNWQQILWFMRNVIDSLQDVSPVPYGTRVGIMSYASVPHMHIDFNFLWGPNINKDRLKGLVNSLHRQPGNDRRIDNAVDFARTNLYSSKGGVRPGSRRVSTLVIKSRCT